MKASPGRHGGCMLSMQWPKGIRQPGPYRQRRQAPGLQLRAVLAAHSTEICTPCPYIGGWGVRAVVAAHSTETCTSATTLAAEGTNRRGYIQHRNPYPRPYIGGCGHGTLGLRTSPNFPLPKAAGQKKKPHKAIDFPLLFRYDNLTAIFSSLCGSFSTKFPPCIFPLKRL